MRTFLTFAGLIILLSSCFEQGECSDVSSNGLKIGFYNYADRKMKTIALDSIKIDGLDSVLFKAAGTSSVELPLNPESDLITCRFYFDNSITVLDVQYNIKTFALAPECLAIDLFSITDATAPTINEIFFTQKEITTDAVENLRLYF